VKDINGAFTTRVLKHSPAFDDWLEAYRRNHPAQQPSPGSTSSPVNSQPPSTTNLIKRGEYQSKKIPNSDKSSSSGEKWWSTSLLVSQAAALASKKEGLTGKKPQLKAFIDTPSGSLKGNEFTADDLQGLTSPELYNLFTLMWGTGTFSTEEKTSEELKLGILITNANEKKEGTAEYKKLPISEDALNRATTRLETKPSSSDEENEEEGSSSSPEW
jgi:hypothetical protein